MKHENNPQVVTDQCWTLMCAGDKSKTCLWEIFWGSGDVVLAALFTLVTFCSQLSSIFFSLFFCRKLSKYYLINFIEPHRKHSHKKERKHYHQQQNHIFKTCRKLVCLFVVFAIERCHPSKMGTSFKRNDVLRFSLRTPPRVPPRYSEIVYCIWGWQAGCHALLSVSL